MGAATVENSMEGHQKVESRTTLGSNNCTTRYLPKEYKNTDLNGYMHADVYTASLAITNYGHRCPSTDEWVKKIWYRYNGILFSHKRSEALTYATTQMNLENAMQGELSHTQKAM